MSDRKILKDNPVVIGALGGSGTRLIAQTLLELGFYFGDDIDDQNDTLLFTRIFQRPEWIRSIRRKKFNRYLSLFTKRMTGNTWSFSDISSYLSALYWKSTIKSGRKKEAICAFTQQWRTANREVTRWGWKEPISHLFLEELCAYYPEMKYIHVIRHGLDMAFSSNTQQLRYWGDRYGLTVNLAEDNIPCQQLEYWIRSNKQAIDIAKKKLGPRFYLLNYDEYCNKPEAAVSDLLRFLDITPSDKDLKHLVGLARPTSTGRYKDRNISQFSGEQIREVRNLGFDVKT